MYSRKLLFLFSTAILFCSLTFAQPLPSESEIERQKKKKEIDERVVQMLEQSIAEAVGLRLAQNRAVVYAMAGDLYWKLDDKRARELFRSAAAAIVAYNFETEKEKRESMGNDPYLYLSEFNDPNDVRPEVLTSIAGRDAELAFELLLQTRPTAVAEAMARTARPSDGDFVTFNPESQRVSQEISLEQRLLLLAADGDPEKTVRMIKESLARGVSFTVIQLLQKLHKKDGKKALELGGEAIKKLVDSDLAKSQGEMRVALNILQYAVKTAGAPDVKDRPFVFGEAGVKELALKMASVFLQPTRSMAMASMLTQALPTLEKLVPERALLLKQRAAANRKNMPDEFRARELRERLGNQNLTAEQLLTEIRKIPNESERVFAYRNLISKINQISDEARAKRLIDQIPDEKFRAAALEQFEAWNVRRATGAGRLEESRRLVGTLTDRNIKVQALVTMAMQTHRKGGEMNVETAKEMMVEAKSLTNEFPDNEDELASLMEIVKGYSTIEPETAFRLFEPVIEQFNEIVHAGAVLSKYNKRDRAFRKGELVMKTNGFGGGVLLFRYISHIQMLSKADFEKMSTLSDRFARADSRTIVRLYVLRGFMK